MSAEAARSARIPSVNQAGLKELKLFQATLMTCDRQLGNFTPLRDRLVASGQDANAAYRRIESRRDQALAELKKLMPPAAPVSSPARTLPPGGSILSLPVSPVRFHPPIWGLGYSGFVQMGRPYEGIDIIPQGQYPTTGSIYSVALDENSSAITFDGDLAVGPASLPANQYSPELNYFWIHNWTYLVTFPAPVVRSFFTYSFNVTAYADIFLLGGPVTLMCFASIGETANFTGQDVPVTTDAGWPLDADLTQPNATGGNLYNGSYGSLTGQVTVQRSFTVEGGQTPAVAVVLGAISCQAMQTEVRLDFPSLGDSYLYPSSNSSGVSGRIDFNYSPQLEVRA
jgi:hypothetical protein